MTAGRINLPVSYGYQSADPRIVGAEAVGSKRAGSRMVAHSNNAADVRLSTDPASLGRAAGGGMVSGSPMPFGQVWMGDYLVGLVDGSKVFYVEPDHLGSPRAVIDHLLPFAKRHG